MKNVGVNIEKGPYIMNNGYFFLHFCKDTEQRKGSQKLDQM